MECRIVVIYDLGLIKFIRAEQEREQRLVRMSKEIVTTDLLLVGGDMREIENPPLWRKTEFRSYVGGVVNSGKKCRNHWSRARRNLWSGERKREA